MRVPVSRHLPALVATVALCTASARAQGGAGPNSEELAKQLSNPAASLVSVPLQLIWEDGIGPNDASRTTLNVQPVVPFSLARTGA